MTLQEKYKDECKQCSDTSMTITVMLPSEVKGTRWSSTLSQPLPLLVNQLLLLPLHLHQYRKTHTPHGQYNLNMTLPQWNSKKEKNNKPPNWHNSRQLQSKRSTMMTNLFYTWKEPRNQSSNHRPFLAIIRLNSLENK